MVRHALVRAPVKEMKASGQLVTNERWGLWVVAHAFTECETRCLGRYQLTCCEWLADCGFLVSNNTTIKAQRSSNSTPHDQNRMRLQVLIHPLFHQVANNLDNDLISCAHKISQLM
eukprot:5868577-Amphidinium_carterae.1